ncbi:hypothetical protein D1871_04585 [Nakamurella silvestris]|nr:hypothetical protein D1871_04585 [Nakamurella silvestris]
MSNLLKDTLVPFEDASTEKERRELMRAAGIKVGLFGRVRPDTADTTIPGPWQRIMAGPRGRWAGRSAWATKVRPHAETTAPLRGLYPWLASQPLPAMGALIGRDRMSGGLFHYDPWELRRNKVISNTGMFITGVIGSGKSSVGKSICLRDLDYGRPFVVPCDIRGEWVPIVEAVDGRVLKLGPGMPDRINALAMPALPDGDITPDQWWLTVRTHWEELLAALIETLFRGTRKLTTVETTAISLAITESARYEGDLDRVRPIHLQLIVDKLLDPSEQMSTDLRMHPRQTLEALRDCGLALQQLTKGSLQGLVDDPSGKAISTDDHATVVDISRVQTSDAAIALVMACTQSAAELAWAHRTQQVNTVYDEYWRLTVFSSLVRRLDAGQRISRKTGGRTITLSHRHTDAHRGDEAARQAAVDLMANQSTHVYYRQSKGTELNIPGVEPLSEVMARKLSVLKQGEAVWMLDSTPYLVNHLLAPAGYGELELVETDQAMEDKYRSLATKDPAALYGAEEAA